MKKLGLLVVAVVMTMSAAFAQIQSPVKWQVASKKINSKEAVVLIKAVIQNGWHIYGQNVPDGGPLSTTFAFKNSKDFALNGKPVESVKAKTKYEEVFKMNVPYFTNEVVFQQKVKLNGKQATVSGTVEYMACDKNQCLPPDEYNFTVAIK
jgi:DsbC/DsbD-like thiol-disulfide interchange protein